MGYEPDSPDGNSPMLNWAKQTHAKAQRERRIQFASGFMGRQTPNGFVPRPVSSIAGFSLPPGIAVREMSVCQKITEDDGSTTTRELFVRGLFSVLYDKNEEGDPIDSEGNILDETTDPPIPDVTDEDTVGGFEIIET
jgi:hypothetical protein